jgi:TolB-like protein/class 3 adenylate cyclase/Flp pilus assembly protein TadD
VSTVDVAELKTLLVCDLVDSTRLVEVLGDARTAELFHRLDDEARRLMEHCGGREIDKTDGFLVLFDRPIQAVRFAAGYQGILESMSEASGVELSARVGIHLGEVVVRENPPAAVARGAKAIEVEGLAKAIAARLMSLAQARQTLLSGTAYEVAHRSTVGSVDAGPPFQWRAHGAYRFKGVAQPVEVYEVGVAGRAPLRQPRDSDKARRVEAQGRPGVLVLPFKDLSPGADTDYISQGLAEEITTSLSSLESLRVISHTAALQLKDRARDIAALAGELNVQYVLEGSVQRVGASLLITARVVRPEQGELVWARSFRGDLAALFEIEETISQSVAAALRVRLSETEVERLRARPIPDVRAYEYYLRAKQQVYRFTEDALDRAVRYLQEGAKLIGENVELHAALGYVYWQYVNLGVAPDPVYLEKARECAERIRVLDPQSPQAERLLGLVTIHAKGDIQEAVRHLKHALAGNPTDPDALFWLALLYGFVGRASSGYPVAERLLEIDPLSAVVHAIPPTLSALDGDFERACAGFARAHRMEPDNPAINFVYSQALAMAGQRGAASSLLGSIERDNPGSFYDGLGRVLRAALAGDLAEAHAALVPSVTEGARADMQYSWTLAQAFALLNEPERALEWLENAIARGFCNYPIIAERDPLLQRMRADPRFRKLERTAKKRWQAFEV